MRQLLATSNVSLVQGLCLALEAEGIELAVNNEAMAPLQPMTVCVLDEDFDRAREVLAGLQSTPSESAARLRPSSLRVRLLLAAALFIIVCGCIELW
jgi:hypothetical protein